MTRLAFGATTLCRYCKASGAPCAACGGVGFMHEPPTNGDEMSTTAAASIAPRAGTLRARVLAVIEATGGATEQDIEQATGLAGNTVRPRLWELERDGFIEKGDRATTASGRPCWRYLPARKDRAA